MQMKSLPNEYLVLNIEPPMSSIPQKKAWSMYNSFLDRKSNISLKRYSFLTFA